MKKIFRSGFLALCFAFVLALSPRAVEYDWQTLYKGEIRTLLSDGDPHYLLLADIDLDGTPELFGGSGPLSPLVPLATCSNGKLMELSLAPGSQTPTSVLQNLRLSFNSETGETLLTCEGNDPAGGYALWELSMENGQLLCRKRFAYQENGNSTSYFMWKSGQLATVSGSEYRTAMDRFWEGFATQNDTLTAQSFFSGGYRSQDADKFLQSYSPASVLALPTQVSVTINGSPLSLGVYNIDGNNYFKLRDLAAALNGTNKQYNVGWDNMTRQVSIERGKPYQPVAGEISLPLGTTPTLGRQPKDALSLDGRTVDTQKYNIGGNNYFKLRDLAELLNFQVLWDNSSRTIHIDTTKSYSQS